MEQEYRSRFDQSRSIMITEFSGLSSPTLDRLRRSLEKLGAEYLVVKNRIFQRALEDSKFSALSSSLEGLTAVALGGDNVPELARLLKDFEEDEDSPQIRAAMWGDELFNASAIKRLAQLPPRPVLLSQLLRGIQAPLTGLASVCNQLLSGLVIVLQGIVDSKES